MSNNITEMSNNITEMEESILLEKERDEYLKLNGNFDIEPEYAFNPENNIITAPRIDYKILNINNNKKLVEEIILLKNKIEELEIKLKKYTNGDNHKRYYEKNKEKIKKDGLSYLKNLKLENPDKIKEYNHNSYIKRKEKKKKLENNTVPSQSDPVPQPHSKETYLIMDGLSNE